MDDDIERDVFEGAGPAGVDEVRLYEDTSRPELGKLPSVTTILKTRDDDKGNLYDWQDRNDGEGNNANHKHLFWYSRHLGTLGHWFALRELDPNLEWSPDEAQSAWALRNVGTLQSADEHYEATDPWTGRGFSEPGRNHEEVLDASAREVLYSVLRGDRDKAGGTVASWGEFYDKYPPYKKANYYEDALAEHAVRDIEFFKDAQLRLWSKLGVSRLNVISVEEYLFNDVDGYAGQVDLVYEDAAGHTVVADLKSSSGCYDKHQMQGAAYGRALEVCDVVDDVDRLEVHRAHPRTGQMAVHTHRDAPGKQAVHTTQYWSDSIEDLWGDFERLIENFEECDWSDAS